MCSHALAWLPRQPIPAIALALASLRLAPFLALAPAGAAAPQAELEVGRPGAATLRAAFDTAFARTPGAVVAGLTHGDTVVGMSVRGAAGGRPADDTTPFDVQDLAQEFTAVLVLRLAMAGTIRLEDTLATHFAGVPSAWQRLAVRHLLEHTSGLPVDLALRDEVVENRDAFVRELLRYAPRTPPGSSLAADCRAEWQLLAALAEAVTVTPFDRLLRERVFAIAGLPDAEVVPAGWDERGDSGVRCSLRDLLRWLPATASGRLLDEASERVLFDDRRDVAPAGRVARRTDGRAHLFQRINRRVVVVRNVRDDAALVVMATEDLALAAHARAVCDALWPTLASGDDLQALAGRYRLGSGDWFDVTIAGAALHVRAAGHGACARLQYGLPTHPEWPDLFKDLEAHAQLHLRPLLKRDAASLGRVFATAAGADAPARAVALIDGLVTQHGEPGKPEILGSRTLGVNATWVRVPFGDTPVTLRVQWHAFQWSDVATEATDYPVSITFLADGDGTFAAVSADGKQKLRLEFARGRGPVKSLRFKDASKTGRNGLVCARE